MKRKGYARVLTVMLTVLLILTQISAAVFADIPASGFPDTKGHYAESVIHQWANKGFVSGLSNGTFAPKKNVTRAEFVTLLNRAFGLTNAISGGKTFRDVKPGDWYYNDVMQAVEMGLAAGYADGRFGAADPITRQDASVIISKFLDLTEVYDASFADRFVDKSDIATYARAHVAAMAELNFINGKGDGTFGPKANITRADSTVMLNNAYAMLSGSSGVAGKVYADGKALAGAIVTILPKDGYKPAQTLTADSNGMYSASVDAGSYDVLVSKDSAVSFKSSVNVRGGYKTFAKVNAEPGQAVTAILKDKEGKPLPNVSLYFKTNPYFSGVSDSQGKVSIFLPKERDYEYFYEKEGELIRLGQLSTKGLTDSLDLGDIKVGVVKAKVDVSTQKPVVSPQAQTDTQEIIGLNVGVGYIDDSWAKYEVSFDLNYLEAKEAPQKQMVAKNGFAKNPGDPQREGYIFGGWYKERSCEKSFAFETERITGDITLYAKWGKKDGTVNESEFGISIHTEELVLIDGSKDIYTVDKKLDHLSGAITGNAMISSIQIKITSNKLEIADQSLNPSSNWSFKNPPLILGRNEVTVSAQSKDGKKASQSIVIVNASEENAVGIIMDQNDTDGDGLLNYQEDMLGTDKTKIDTDGDGLTDYQEIYFVGTNPLEEDSDKNGILDGNEDPDKDGVKTIDEFLLNGNPTMEDTDLDGLKDGEEVSCGTKLDVEDTDHDGLSDGDEVALGLDPLKASTDGVTPDAQRKFQQTLKKENIADILLSEENIAKPQLSVNGPGNLNGKTFIWKESTLAKGNKAVVGTPIEIESRVDLSSGATLSFEINNITIEESDVLRSLVICRQTEDNIELMDTVVGINSVSTEITEDGKYLVLDIGAYLLNLGVDMRSYFPETEAIDDITREFFLKEEIKNEGNQIISGEHETSNQTTQKPQETQESMKEVSQPMGMTSPSAIDMEERVITKASPSFASVLGMEDKIMGQADIVFIVDSTGSMGEEISNVAKNINTFAQNIYSKYNINANYAIVNYKDIEADGHFSTVFHKNWNSYWFNGMNIKDFKDAINSIRVKGGGDDDETPIDALEAARQLVSTSKAKRFFILVTDAGYKTANRYEISSMDDMISSLRRDGINVSVITTSHEQSKYANLYKMTGGVYGDINDDFSFTLEKLFTMIGGETNDGNWILLKRAGLIESIRLKENPASGRKVDTDGDGLMDLEELIKPEKMSLKPLIEGFIKIVKINRTWEDYLKAGGKETLETWTYRSHPGEIDSDSDGDSDKFDEYPLKWDISDRDLAMCASMCYSNLEKGLTLGPETPEYWKKEINKRFNEGTHEVAHVSELIGWKVYDSCVKENFNGLQVVAFEKDGAIVVAYRGTQNWYNDGPVDAGQYFAGLNGQVSGAKRFIEMIIREKSEAEIYVTGHSLGGNLAYYSGAHALDIKPVSVMKINTYNGFGLSAWNRGTHGLLLNAFSRVVTDYFVDGDRVYSLPITFHFGRKLKLRKSDFVQLYDGNKQNLSIRNINEKHNLYTFLEYLKRGSQENRLYR